MDILLYKDGHLAISDAPLEGKENNLDDVVMLVTNPQDGDTLTYKSGKWVNGEGGGSGGFSPDITNPQDGDTLVYNATAGKWVNGSGGGGVLVVHTVYDAGNTSLDKTWQEIYDALASGTPCICVYENAKDEIVNQAYLTGAELYDEGVYNVYTIDMMTTYVATSPSGYPAVGES